MQSHPLSKTRFSQYQASSAAVQYTSQWVAQISTLFQKYSPMPDPTREERIW